MAKLSIASVVRELLTANPVMSTDEVIKKAKARGLTAPDNSIRHGLHNLRKEFRQPGTKKTPEVVRKPTPQSAASTKFVSRKSTSPALRSAPVKTTAAIPVVASVAVSAPLDLAIVLANVALVNRVQALCGGPENTRQVAEAIRTCGGLEPFLQHLDLVAGIRKGDPDRDSRRAECEGLQNSARSSLVGQ